MTPRLCLLLLLVLGCTHAHGQKATEDYMEEARYERNNGHDSAALATYRYVIEKHPTSTLCSDAYMSIAQIYEKQGRQADAIATYRTIIALAEKERAKKQSGYFNGEGSEAASILSNYQEKRGNYDSAIYYLALSDSVFQMFYGCGNAEEAAQQATIIRYAELNLKANRVRDAEITLLAHIYPTLFDTRNIVLEKLSELYKKYEDPKHLKAEMEKAVNNYTLDSVYRANNYGIDTTIYCTINFTGVKVRNRYERRLSEKTPPYDKTDNTTLPQRERVIAYLKGSELYKMVEGL